MFYVCFRYFFYYDGSHSLSHRVIWYSNEYTPRAVNLPQRAGRSAHAALASATGRRVRSTQATEHMPQRPQHTGRSE